MKTAIRLALAVFCAGAVLVRADETFRCGKWIVNSGLSVAELTTRCGSPDSKDSRTEDVMVRNRNTGLMMKMGETTIETWIYDRGTQAAPMVVTIVDGKIKSIDRMK